MSTNASYPNVYDPSKFIGNGQGIPLDTRMGLAGGKRSGSKRSGSKRSGSKQKNRKSQKNRVKRRCRKTRSHR